MKGTLGENERGARPCWNLKVVLGHFCFLLVTRSLKSFQIGKEWLQAKMRSNFYLKILLSLRLESVVGRIMTF